MYKRLTLLSLIIIAGLCGLSWLGYRAIGVWAQGLEGTRISEFAEVAGQIRSDVTRKLDEFLEQEENRPYTDYQYYYIPDNRTTSQRQQATVALSPLAGLYENGVAYNYFQVNPDQTVTTPNVDMGIIDKPAQSDDYIYKFALANTRNVKDNLLPILNDNNSQLTKDIKQDTPVQVISGAKDQESGISNTAGKSKAALAPNNTNQQSFSIESLNRQQRAETQVEQRSREFIATNMAVQSPVTQQQKQTASQPTPQAGQIAEPLSGQLEQQQLFRPQQAKPSDVVVVRTEPFKSVIVKSNGSEESIFGGQIFRLRRVEIENQQYYQGFQVNEKKLLEEVQKSTQRFLREGMNFEIGSGQKVKPAFTAVLDFGFGNLLLNLIDTNPALVNSQVHRLRVWYFSILSVVFLVVMAAMVSLWLSAAAQNNLTRKKDDFVSAVSHELRTPLTSIRMHAEMLEKSWVKSPDKLGEYYSKMRAESERLSRLIENVLDFSRIQRGKKKYSFKLGDIDKCIADVVAMMTPYAVQRGFVIATQFDCGRQVAFDNDAVTQIVVNLLDNAVKYAANAADKTIVVRTRSDRNYTVIEVEDHGPGIPHRQQKKVFEPFYRIAAEATRETQGSGLGLALVKKFAQAHNGFVEIINARPSGAIFRVALEADKNILSE
jgi:signal transduction histidine kinase